MSAAHAVTPLHPTRVEYKGHTIKLTHRVKVNDWTYEIKHTRTIVLKNHAPRYDTALSAAKNDIDALTKAE